MNPIIDRLKILFLGLFVAACVAIVVDQLVWLDPAKRCEQHGAWWDPAGRVCAAPLYLPNLTGRPAGTLSPEALKARALEASAKEAQTLGVKPSVKSTGAP